jgi:hypothetical protein
MASFDGGLVRFGGWTDTASAVDETWIWTGLAWTKLAVKGPPARAHALMVPIGDRLILSGGWDVELSPLSDTWAWDGSVWTELGSSSLPAPSPCFLCTPSPIGVASAAFEGSALLFGGCPSAFSGLGGLSAQTVTWGSDASDASASSGWQNLALSGGPPARCYASMATR